MVHLNPLSLLIGAAGLSAAVALPAGQARVHQSSRPSTTSTADLVRATVDLNPLHIQAVIARDEGLEARHSNKKHHGKGRKHGKHGKNRREEQGADKRDFVGKLGRRARNRMPQGQSQPHRAAEDNQGSGDAQAGDGQSKSDMINVDLGDGPHDHHGSLVNVQARDPRHRHYYDDDDWEHDHDHDHDHGHHHGHHHHHRSLDVEDGQLEKRHSGHNVVIVDDRHRHRHHGHGYRHGDTIVKIHNRDGLEARKPRHPVVIVEDGHGRHGHHRHHTTVVEARDGDLEARRHRDNDYDHRHHHGHHHHHHHKRDDSGIPDGSPGYIDVTSPSYNSTSPITIASLVLSTDNSTDSNSTFVLNASTNMRTRMYLSPVHPSKPSTDGIEVNLKIPVFVASTATTEQYCATFDGAPSAPAPLTVTPCHNATDPHESQIFLYDSKTGVISPMWQATQATLASLPSMSGDDVADSGDMSSGNMTAMAGGDSYDDDDESADYDEDDLATPSASASPFYASASPSPTVMDYSTFTYTSYSASITYSAIPSASAIASASASASAFPNDDIEAAAVPSPSAFSSGNASNVTLVFTPASASATDPESEEATEMGLNPYPEGDAVRTDPSASTSATATATSSWLFHSPTPETASTSASSSLPSSSAALSRRAAEQKLLQSPDNVRGEFTLC